MTTINEALQGTMIRVKTSQLKELALNWAVAKCEGIITDDTETYHLSFLDNYMYSIDCAQSGPIIDRNKIGVWPAESIKGKWAARPYEKQYPRGEVMYGPTRLIAAMRCYVATKLGTEVDIPSELAKQR